MLNTLFTPMCTLCGNRAAHKQAICSFCHYLMMPLTHLHRCKCGIPIWEAMQNANETAINACHQCQREAPVFTLAHCGYRYSYPLNQLINQYKRYRNVTLEGALQQLWLAHVRNIQVVPDALIPIPLHWRRRCWRGFNQSHRLALWASKELNIPLLTPLVKQRATSKQQGKNRQERLHNLHQAFRFIGPHLHLKHIALIDDVLTTGTTANEASKVLLQHGVQRVDIWALAQAF